MSNALVDFYRCPESLVALASPRELQPQPGYFTFDGAVCYGKSVFSSPAEINGGALPDLARYVGCHESGLRLPFNARTVVDNLRFERYPANGHPDARSMLSSEAVRRIYYTFRPLLPHSFRKRLQRLYLRDWEKLVFPKWPVDTSVENTFERILLLSMKARNLARIPFIWFWPDGASSSAIVTHDVETNAGLNFVSGLMDVDDVFGIKASFQIVPEERYTVSKDLLKGIRQRGCEVNVHGLNHDGNLFRDRKTFLNHAKWINRYVQDYGAEGFRSACMYRNLDWYEDLNISYDMSVPNVAHLEPQLGGCCTVFPYFIGRILELPLTTVQDYSLFHILRDYSIELWKKQIELITEKHGLISFIAHPDYLLDERALSVYKTLLAYLSQLRTERNIWIARPGDVSRWWRERSAMKLILEDGKWRIQGPGRECARVAFASVRNGHIEYTVAKSYEASAGREIWSNSFLNSTLPIAETS